METGHPSTRAVNLGRQWKPGLTCDITASLIRLKVNGHLVFALVLQKSFLEADHAQRSKHEQEAMSSITEHQGKQKRK